jgi:transcription elongation factor Elf1
MPEDISNHLVKSEFLVDKINEIMRLRPAIVNALNPFDNRPDFRDSELESVTSFLMSQLSDNKVPEKVVKQEVAPIPVKAEASVDSILQCKSCGEKSDYSAQYGRYGYFIKCHKCETNTAMKIPCLSCASKKTKVSKNKEVYTLYCSDCEQGTVLI